MQAEKCAERLRNSQTVYSPVIVMLQWFHKIIPLSMDPDSLSGHFADNPAFTGGFRRFLLWLDV